MNDETFRPNVRPERPAGKLTGPKPPVGPGHVWLIRANCNLKGAHETWRCLILRSTASCAAAILSRCASKTCQHHACELLYRMSDLASEADMVLVRELGLRCVISGRTRFAK